MTEYKVEATYPKVCITVEADTEEEAIKNAESELKGFLFRPLHLEIISRRGKK
jgi:hypothetical protein